ncbi:hypothetical protein FOZ62_001993, partial [Perkinsus olseni]
SFERGDTMVYTIVRTLRAEGGRTSGPSDSGDQTLTPPQAASSPDLHADNAVSKVMKAYNSTVHSVTHRIPVEVFKLDPIGKASDRVEWERLVNNAVKLAEEKLQRSTKHDLFPGAIVRLRDVHIGLPEVDVEDLRRAMRRLQRDSSSVQ